MVLLEVLLDGTHDVLDGTFCACASSMLERMATINQVPLPNPFPAKRRTGQRDVLSIGIFEMVGAFGIILRNVL
jgi:hypothetical protein